MILLALKILAAVSLLTAVVLFCLLMQLHSADPYNWLGTGDKILSYESWIERKDLYWRLLSGSTVAAIVFGAVLLTGWFKNQPR